MEYIHHLRWDCIPPPYQDIKYPSILIGKRSIENDIKTNINKNNNFDIKITSDTNKNNIDKDINIDSQKYDIEKKRMSIVRLINKINETNNVNNKQENETTDTEDIISTSDDYDSDIDSSIDINIKQRV